MSLLPHPERPGRPAHLGPLDERAAREIVARAASRAPRLRLPVRRVARPPAPLGPAGLPGATGPAPEPARPALAFAPLHKLAFGVAMGSAAALLVAGATVVHVLRGHGDDAPIRLLGQYFYGYSVSWEGAAVGGFWGFVAGFTAGWFVAFVRNLSLAASVFLTRTRAELEATRDFLDHV